MNFKNYLLSLGIDNETADKVVNGMPENKFYISENENIDSRYSKLKEQKEQFENDLGNANQLISELQKSTKDNAELQTQLESYKKQAEEAEQKQAEISKTYAIKDKLRDFGVKDLDYVMFKLGDMEMDKDGNIKDLDNKVKELKQSIPDFFKEEPQSDDTSKNGYKPLDNALEGGNGGEDPEATAIAEFAKAVGVQE